jgi:hypothetical protein
MRNAASVKIEMFRDGEGAVRATFNIYGGISETANGMDFVHDLLREFEERKPDGDQLS